MNQFDTRATGRGVSGLDRPRRLRFSWESPYSTDDSTVTLDFAEIDSAATWVELTHVKFLHEEARSDHEGGWGNIKISGLPRVY